MNVNNTEKFSGKADFYLKSRPGYPAEFIKYLRNSVKLNDSSIVADVGSGTGKFSEEILKLGCKVFCVEPNKDMREAAESVLSEYLNFISVNGTAEKTSVNDKSVDFVTVAQAFHWFDSEIFKNECKRILKPGGKVILVWNSRISDSEIVMENAEVLEKYCPDFRGFSGGVKDMDGLISGFFCDGYEKERFKYDLEYDMEKFIQRTMSASYFPDETHENYSACKEAICQLFDKYAVEGILTVPNETVSYMGRV